MKGIFFYTRVLPHFFSTSKIHRLRLDINDFFRIRSDFDPNPRVSASARLRWKMLIFDSVEFDETAPSAIVGFDAVAPELAFIDEAGFSL